MVRVLATVILSYTSRARVFDCEHIAKALVQKFPFLKEYVSYILFLCNKLLIIQLGVLGNIYLCEISEL